MWKYRLFTSSKLAPTVQCDYFNNYLKWTKSLQYLAPTILISGIWGVFSDFWSKNNQPHTIITKQFGFSPSPHPAYDLSCSCLQESKSWVHHHSAGKLMRWQDPGTVIHGPANHAPGRTKYVGIKHIRTYAWI